MLSAITHIGIVNAVYNKESKKLRKWNTNCAIKGLRMPSSQSAELTKLNGFTPS